MTSHPLTKDFITNLSESLHRMCRQIIETGDEPHSIETLGEAFVFYMELAILASLPLAPDEIKEHANPLVKAAKEHLRVAAGMIAVDRLYHIGRGDAD